MKKYCFGIYSFIQTVVNNFFKDDGLSRSSALSYSTLLSIVPLSALILSMFSLFPGFADLSKELENFVYQNLVPTSGDVIKQYLTTFVEKAGALRALGLLFFFLTALLLLANIENTLNKIWLVKKGRKIGQRILMYWAMLTLGPLLMGAGLAISSYISANKAFDFVESNLLISKLHLLPFLFEMAAFWLMYTLVPNRNVSMKYSLLGAFIATLLFTSAQKVFILWVSSFQSYTIIYGTLSTIPVFLIWIFVSWNVILIGAEVAAIPHRNANNKQQDQVN